MNQETQIYRIHLDDIKVNESKIIKGCHRLEIINASSANALLNISIVSREGEVQSPLPMTLNAVIENPFLISEIVLDSEAQANAWVDVFVINLTSNPPSKFSYIQPARSLVEEVVKPVKNKSANNIRVLSPVTVTGTAVKVDGNADRSALIARPIGGNVEIVNDGGSYGDGIPLTSDYNNKIAVSGDVYLVSDGSVDVRLGEEAE